MKLKHPKFEKGQFIKQSTAAVGSFAIFEGDVYEPTVKGGPNEYSLMCFYNPEHYIQDENGDYKREYVFECDVDDDTCQYIIDDTDTPFWRVCTEYEKQEALRFLAEVKHIAFDERTCTLRKLLDNEKISFEPPKNTGVPGGNVQHHGSETNLNPFYRGNRCLNPNPRVETKKLITRNVSENWEQKEPISNMNEEHAELVSAQCEKLKYAFDTYSTNVMSYPTNGRQVPTRYGYDACGWPIENNVAAMFGGRGWWDYED